MSDLISPHGGKGLICSLLKSEELKSEIKKAETLKQIPISGRENGDLIMLGIGAFSPLNGFMTRADWKGVSESFLLQDGTFWPMPITLSVSREEAGSIRTGDEIALKNTDGVIMATMKVVEKYEMSEADKKWECEMIYKGEGEDSADDVFWEIALDEHPGVQMVLSQKEVNLAGPVKLLSEGSYPERFPNVYMTPDRTRTIFEERGWKNVAALQIRNPMHQSHEYLARLAVEVCDGVLIHSLIGGLKLGDIPPLVTAKCIETLIEHYFVKKYVLLGGYPLDMRYAGPREALLHAVLRQNYGVSKMIVGRDHAGTGDFYGLFEGQNIFDKIPSPEEPGKRLLCSPLKIDWTFYCHECDGIGSLRTCPHKRNSRVLLSGTKLRKLISESREVPDHFAREQVLDILREYYGGLTKKVEIKLQRWNQ